jgi:photosystem II stability/assembly factor-like uncharacterized protein
VSLYEDGSGFAVGGSGLILHTNDAGATWQDQESSSQANLYAVQVVDNMEAVAVGELGTVLVTTDGGHTWEVQPSVTGKVLQAVVYRGGRQLWVAGRGGTILKRTEPLSPFQTTAETPSAAQPGIERRRPNRVRLC